MCTVDMVMLWLNCLTLPLKQGTCILVYTSSESFAKLKTQQILYTQEYKMGNMN